MVSPPADHHLSGQQFKTSNEGKSVMEPTDTVTNKAVRPPPVEEEAGLLEDIITMNWLRKPKSSMKMIFMVLLYWGTLEAFRAPSKPNPLAPGIMISYPLPRLPEETVTHYGKGPLDYYFLAFYVVVFSCIRQSVTEFVLRPFAKSQGIKGETKLLRFMEQGYAFLYFSVFGSLGLWVMSRQPTWWFKTEQFWLDWPHNRLRPEVKTYYLLQFSYWLQQMLVLVLRMEKPRSDFRELVIHHMVTLWLIGWSYVMDLTRIGVAIFVTMDVSDIFLALSKCLNYLKLQRTSEIAFVFFMGVWTYFRHYLNLVILWSVYFEFTLIPGINEMVFDPMKGQWMVWWIQWQTFLPILLLQFVNLFWYYLIWRVIYKILRNDKASDVREEDENSDDEDEKKQQ